MTQRVGIGRAGRAHGENIFGNPPTIDELLRTPFDSSNQHSIESNTNDFGALTNDVSSNTIIPDPDITHETTVQDQTLNEEYEIFESQLLSRDETSYESRWSQDVSCLYPNSTQINRSNQNPNLSKIEESFSESIVYNPPEWHFESRNCTKFNKLNDYHHQNKKQKTTYDLIFHLNEINPIRIIPLKNPRRGQCFATLAEFDCIDDTGSTLKITLWDEAATELSTVCKTGDIIFLSCISLSTFRDQLQGNTTDTTRAQICYRLKPIGPTDLSFCYDLRLDFDPTTRRIDELVKWARNLFEYHQF
ncbi:uncharacterized protein MELLADRAFT_100964 [Melampsora larici-populina 98AG31]|uniref:Shieldin complex subunit 2 first OB fold domain-containing protein n=1 Tax=Melampsora larici-populina (strain 98AG31 / pathotype 3-4-7) TaxID=747676 RepID=F4R354_MELLP|nr:uncharacterized protein MELLADRAFT_100964 [Melampsora larici-populina 98AG31]EGG12569.1 hypothetical protein MELLADRAFT_100964 [Melampsora larici-populina 98AG31]